MMRIILFTGATSAISHLGGHLTIQIYRIQANTAGKEVVDDRECKAKMHVTKIQPKNK